MRGKISQTAARILCLVIRGGRRIVLDPVETTLILRMAAWVFILSILVVNFPTKSISIILLFPVGQPCTSIRGFEQVGKNESHEGDREKGMPIIVDEGKLVYWRIPNPLFGAEYQLEWEWQNTATVTKAAGI